MRKILAFLIALILFSCSKSDEISGFNFDQKTFEKNRQLWEQNKINNYTFSQKYSSTSIGSQPKLTSVVKNNQLDSIFVQSNNTSISDLGEVFYYGTVNKVFQHIEWVTGYYENILHINDGYMKGVFFEITYDETYHYPTKIKYTGDYFGNVNGGLNVLIELSDFDVQ
ncbi:hypothetical protein GCM10011416_14410 [Polaribacter pacificus]|uniref:Lipoprotein n=1 Tax=Polaribacter pacificus TaxID=1775173 RepID=A0A917HZA5_9FLAO|nr:DUF6174 domain-containing protein [Polaribacter pacificus]GGG97508.1 hypothetical protein GCM10011416_14410 [Polaribacter pacificus]